MSESAEKSRTTNEFVSLLRKWVEKTGQAPVVEFFADRYSVRFPEVPPDSVTLWRAYLTETLPDPYKRAVLADNSAFPPDRHSLLQRLSALQEYTPEQTFMRILGESALRFLANREMERTVARLFAFHRHLGRWLDGTFHLSIVGRELSGFRQIGESMQFESDWSCARFLRSCGYPVVFSFDSYRAWCRFSGRSREADGYGVWRGQLESLALSAIETNRTEAFLDVLFGKSDKLGLPTLCSCPASCVDCPLSSDCRFYRNHYSPEFSRRVENSVLSGAGAEVPTREILQYLLNRHWDDSDFQNDCLKQFPDLSPNAFACEPGTSHRDSFFLGLLAIQELVRRKPHSGTDSEEFRFSGSEDIFNRYRYPLSHKTQESFHILILDNKHRTLKMNMVTTGTLNQSLVHPREVFAPAIQLRAAAIILVHNHPSGDPEPSPQDFEITKRLAEVGTIVGIKVLDHVIVGKSSYYSFMDEGTMP